ncbi:NADH dehydrogenase [Anaerobacillus alkalidiazotrophicus]|uniref:NADH-quinone oxidoreductase subunit C n=1 Tax=Anaerobacillus alkalidiazotrophicus TaxID=472963 RepID=A0A1S2MAL9_9BACI|nr:NADH-quinone oxidoreductase subunit C [Anaerobacillus alkalidiazotrophicus]OIJ21781.1 NADH dehydrogenase [Anaerobacillus alkalidiazotrophicus]
MSQPLLDKVLNKIEELSGLEVVIESKLNFEEPFLIIDSENWKADIPQMLRDDEELRFDFLCCLTGVDYEEHMEVIYNFYSMELDHYLCIKVKTPRSNPKVISVQPIWRTADWHEREAYDLLGIEFSGHPNLKRILLDDDWEGHPLRKDYKFNKEEMGLS